jgi:hypothetical protein
MPITNFPDGFSNGVNIRGLPLLNAYAGNLFWVDSATGVGVDAGTSGTKKRPFASLGYALDQCVADNGDVIMVAPGHAETLTVGFTLDVAGVSIIGLGSGDSRPTLTVNGAIDGVSVSGDNTVLHNFIIVAGASVTAASRLMSFTTANNVKISKCRFEMNYDMYHMIYIKSGDDIKITGCEMVNTIIVAASVHPQTALLNTGGTNVIVSDCRFQDTLASKAEQWLACVEGGTDVGSMVVEDCTFICRGVATRTRTAAASDGTAENAGTMATLFCRAISPSGNTATGFVYTPTFQYIIQSYDVAAVNKLALIAVTSS